MPSAVPFHRGADLLPEPVLVVALDGALHSVNAAFCRTFGWSPSEFAGRSAFDLLSPAPEVRQYLRRCAAVRALVPGAVLVQHRDGRWLACRSSGGLLQPRAGGESALVFLRITPRAHARTGFTALTQKINALGVEIARRRSVEAQLAVALGEQHALRDRLGILTEAAGTLFAELSVDGVIAGIGALARRLFNADAYAVWRMNPDVRTWSALWKDNLSDGFLSAISEWSGAGRVSVPFAEALFVTNYDDVPLLSERRASYVAEGIHALMIVPLRIGAGTDATVVGYYRRPVTFDESDRRVATALGNLGSSALATAVLYENERRSRTASELAERRAAFLARTASVLASSLDEEQALRTVAQLAVPEIADWCAVDMLNPAGQVERIAVAHVNPEKVAFVEALQREYPPEPGSPHGAQAVLRTGLPEVLPEVPDELLRAGARDDRHLALIRSLGLSSCMCVPLRAQGRTIGALTFASAESGRRYTDDDLRFAEDVASRAALAVDNASAYAALRSANRLKDDFLATLSHELRTPLNAVLGYTRMLRSGALPAGKEPAALEAVERNAAALAQLVEDVLDISRIEAGKIRLNVQRIDLASVMDRALATVAPAADAKHIAVETVVTPGLPAINADPDRLLQVAWNILSNAVKFTPRGGRVQVRLEQVDGALEMAVSDTGPGIPAAFLPHLFEPFRQADRDFTREHGGLGLGLAISRHLVEMHGGTIEACNAEQDHGTVFRVRLPSPPMQT